MPLAEKLDPVALSLTNAPGDDEPETEEELRAIAETREALRAGKPLTVIVSDAARKERSQTYRGSSRRDLQLPK